MYRAHKDHQALLEKEEIEDHLYEMMSCLMMQCIVWYNLGTLRFSW